MIAHDQIHFHQKEAQDFGSMVEGDILSFFLTMMRKYAVLHSEGTHLARRRETVWDEGLGDITGQLD